jgi:hypothetical protein
MNEEVWSMGGMILIGTSRSTLRKRVPYKLCLPQTPHGLGLHSERLANDSLSHDLAFSGKLLELKYVFKPNLSSPSVHKTAHVV